MYEVSDKKYGTEDVYFNLPTLVLIEYIAFLPSGYLLKLMGTRFTTLLGLILTLIHYLILYFITNFWTGLIAMGIFGCGIGLGYFPLLSTSWQYFPEKKGLLSGIILSCFGSAAFIWTAIADNLINPKKIKVQESGDYKKYYTPDISKKIIDFWKIMIFVVIGAMIIVGLLSFEYYEDDIEKEDLINEDDNNDEDEKIDLKIKKKKDNDKINHKLILRIFFSWEYIRLVLMQFGCSMFLYLVSIMMRPFGEQVKGLSINALQVLSLVCSILNGICRIIWGPLLDCIGVKLCVYIDIGLYIFSSGVYYFCGSHIVLYYIINIITQFSNSGSSVIMAILNRQICGEYFLILWGYAGVIYGISSWIGPFFVKVLDIEKRGAFVYMITFLICCGLCIISMILYCFIGDKPIDFNKYKTPEELAIDAEKNKELVKDSSNL